MPLFDEYLIVDWSAANSPKLGKDSIWIAHAIGPHDISIRNIATRFSAAKFIKEKILDAINNKIRLFIGCDFAFGFPSGTCQTLKKEKIERDHARDHWRHNWVTVSQYLVDNKHNKSNRFEAAARLNQKICAAPGPFWGHPHQHEYENLSPTKPENFPAGLSEKRIVEQRVASTKSIWQLAYNGAVGSQSLLGMLHLNELRMDDDIPTDAQRVWPFETNFAEALDASVILAEIYPSLVPITLRKGEILDAAQVHTLAKLFADLDWQQNKFRNLLSKPDDLQGEDLTKVLNEEGWIVGVVNEDLLR